MHEKERHRIILSLVQTRPVATVQDLIEMTGTSEATVRRDIAALHIQGRLRRVRGGAEAITPPSQTILMGRPYKVNEAINLPSKRAIAREAVALCNDGEAIIINGRSEEHTSELQSRRNLVCRLLLEKKQTTCKKTPQPTRAVPSRMHQSML